MSSLCHSRKISKNSHIQTICVTVGIFLEALDTSLLGLLDGWILVLLYGSELGALIGFELKLKDGTREIKSDPLHLEEGIILDIELKAEIGTQLGSEEGKYLACNLV